MMSGKLRANAATTFLLGIMAILSVIRDGEVSAPLLDRPLRGKKKSNAVFIPPSLDAEIQKRLLTINLGGGLCEYEFPVYDVPEGIDFHKTLIAGYPSGDKRMIFLQMEALTGWPAKDEWDFEYLGMSNHPFIKANYPHHEGIWGWDGAADQVVLMIRNMRRSMVEYHDILWDIDYAQSWEIAAQNRMDLYMERAPLDAFYIWRDDRIMDEVYWYGWEIDFWMEGGLLRDIFTHDITTEEHWNKTRMHAVYHRHDLEVIYETQVRPGVEDGSIGPAYERHCAGGAITDGCEPVAVISAEVLRNDTVGPSETEQIANLLLLHERTGQYVIAEEAWDCVWEELIMNGKGLKTVYDRPGFVESDYNFSREMLELMIWQLDRLITKYGGPEWESKATANRIVELLSEHLVLIQEELDDVIAGRRQLTERDFLGREERERRSKSKARENPEGEIDAVQEEKDYTEFFMSLERELKEDRERKRRETILATAGRRKETAGEFAELLSKAAKKVLAMEASGETDSSTATSILKRIERVALKLKPLLADSSDEE